MLHLPAPIKQVKEQHTFVAGIDKVLHHDPKHASEAVINPQMIVRGHSARHYKLWDQIASSQLIST